MLKFLSALLLAVLLAVAAYVGFWWACLYYTTSQMKGQIAKVLDADVSYGAPVWVPDLTQVNMDLPGFTLVMKHGPIAELHAPHAHLIAGFLTRDRWTLQLPSQVEVRLSNGKRIVLQTSGGEVKWVKDSNLLSLSADSVALLGLQGGEKVRINDVVMERRLSDTGVHLNLASRPEWDGKQAILSGRLDMPDAAFATVLPLFGQDSLPSLGQLLQAVAGSLRAHGGTLTLQDVSFKAGNESLGLFGDVGVMGDGRMTGQPAVSADSLKRLQGWLEHSGAVNPRNVDERFSMQRFLSDSNPMLPTARLSMMQDTLLLNGYPIGPLPNVDMVVRNLWPR